MTIRRCCCILGAPALYETKGGIENNPVHNSKCYGECITEYRSQFKVPEKFPVTFAGRIVLTSGTDDRSVKYQRSIHRSFLSSASEAEIKHYIIISENKESILKTKTTNNKAKTTE